MSTDTELLDFLEGLNSRKLYTGKCVLRMSIMSRGWRLHETSKDDASDTVREAIERFKATEEIAEMESEAKK